jgi:hypothetical protein
MSRAVFTASTSWKLGNGKKCLFWEDQLLDGKNVEMVVPLLLEHVDGRTCKSRTVEQGMESNAWVRDIDSGLSIPALVQFLALWNLVSNIELVMEVEDKLDWKWTQSKQFSTKSTYWPSLRGAPSGASINMFAVQGTSEIQDLRVEGGA